MHPSHSIGILYPGELGAALGTVLVARGVRVITTLQSRSARTAHLSAGAGLIALDSLEEVIGQSDVLVSLVPPGAAEELADQYAAVAHLAPPGAVYVDANSINPDHARAIGEKIAACGRTFVDASIHGAAQDIGATTTLYLSGAKAREVAQLWEGAMRVRVLGSEPGRASAMKMVLAGISKGLCALFLEVAVLARRQGMLAELNQEASRFYPGVFAAVDRMLPTYPQHAARRTTEMGELEEAARNVGQEPCLISAIHRLLAEVSRVPFDASGVSDWTTAAIVEELMRNQFLAGAVPVEHSSST